MTRIDSAASIHPTSYNSPTISAVAGESPSPTLLEPAPAASLPILGRLHLLMIQADRQKRAADRKAEEQFEAEEAAADAQRIQEMRDKADNALCMGLLTAGLQVTTAVASTVATAKEFSAMLKRDAAQHAFDKATTGLNEADTAQALRDSKQGNALTASERAFKRAEKGAKLVEANGKGVEGARTGLDALARSQASDADKKITELENQSKAARRAADRVKSEQETTMQAEAKILQLAKEIADAQAACERAAILRM